MRLFLKLILVVLVCLNFGCDKDPQTPSPSIEIPFYSKYSLTELEQTTDFQSTGVSRGQVAGIDEASGLASSLSNPEHLWVHEDSGAEPLISLMDQNNTDVIVSYRITDAQNRDWEDMAAIKSLNDSRNYLYLGDIGDNNAQWDHLMLYRLEEPLYNPVDSGTVVDITGASSVKVYYPDGARDAETLLVDPATEDVFVVTKRENRNRLYRLPYPQNWSGTDSLEFVGSFPISGIVGGDISADGHVLLKTYSGIFYWKKQRDEPLSHLLSRKPVRAPYDPVELQGEAICWSGSAYYTLSEKLAGVTPSLYHYTPR